MEEMLEHAHSIFQQPQAVRPSPNGSTKCPISAKYSSRFHFPSWCREKSSYYLQKYFTSVNRVLAPVEGAGSAKGGV